MCYLLHFKYDPYRLHEKPAPFIGQPPALSCQGQPLAGGAKRDDVYRREPPAMELCDVSYMGHFREMPPGDGYTFRHDLTGP